VIDVPRERFEKLVADALDGIPEELGQYMDNVAVFVEDVPPEPRLLGLYQGVPLTARGTSYSGTMPDRISIYRNTICAISNSEDEVVEQVRRTVIHEVAHHFGISDPRLRELGW
jgi:predicted Zn-dependent protease with MMP-like domain